MGRCRFVGVNKPSVPLLGRMADRLTLDPKKSGAVSGEELTPILRQNNSKNNFRQPVP